MIGLFHAAGTSSPNDYFILSGTSMVTPAVTGGVTLMLQQNPNLIPDQAKTRLMKTANKTFPVTTDPTTGQSHPSDYDLFRVGVRGYDGGAWEYGSSSSGRGLGTVADGFVPRVEGKGDVVEREQFGGGVFGRMGIVDGREGGVLGYG